MNPDAAADQAPFSALAFSRIPKPGEPLQWHMDFPTIAKRDDEIVLFKTDALRLQNFTSMRLLPWSRMTMAFSKKPDCPRMTLMEGGIGANPRSAVNRCPPTS